MAAALALLAALMPAAGGASASAGFVAAPTVTRLQADYVALDAVYDGEVDAVSAIAYAAPTPEGLSSGAGRVSSGAPIIAVSDLAFGIVGLQPSTTYYAAVWYRPCAGCAGLLSGRTSFTTLAPPGSVSAPSASVVGPHTARLLMTVTGSVHDSQVWVATTAAALAGSERKPCSTPDLAAIDWTRCDVVGLAASTVYYAAAYYQAVAGGAWAWGPVGRFKTLPAPPALSAPSWSSVNSAAVVLKASISGKRSDPVGFTLWGADGSAPISVAFGAIASGSFSKAVSGLAPATTYCVRAWVVDYGFRDYGPQKCLRTAADPALASVPIPNIPLITSGATQIAPGDGTAPIRVYLLHGLDAGQVQSTAYSGMLSLLAERLPATQVVGLGYYEEKSRNLATIRSAAEVSGTAAMPFANILYQGPGESAPFPTAADARPADCAKADDPSQDRWRHDYVVAYHLAWYLKHEEQRPGARDYWIVAHSNGPIVVRLALLVANAGQHPGYGSAHSATDTGDDGYTWPSAYRAACWPTSLTRIQGVISMGSPHKGVTQIGLSGIAGGVFQDLAGGSKFMKWYKARLSTEIPGRRWTVSKTIDWASLGSLWEVVSLRFINACIASSSSTAPSGIRIVFQAGGLCAVEPPFARGVYNHAYYWAGMGVDTEGNAHPANLWRDGEGSTYRTIETFSPLDDALCLILGRTIPSR